MLTAELPGVLEVIQDERQRQISRRSREYFMEEVFGQSPKKASFDLEFSLDLDLQRSRESSNHGTLRDPLEFSSKKKARMYLFVDQTVTSFKFEKEVPKPATPQVSLISAEMIDIQRRAADVAARKPNIKIYISDKEVMNVVIEEKMTVDDVIRKTMQVHASNVNRATKLNDDPMAYILRFAENDGTVDDDMPSMVRNREIAQFIKGWSVFRLVVEAPPAAKTPQLLKVIFPNNDGFMSVAYKDETLLRLVMDQVCKKYVIDNPQLLYFEYEAGFSKIGMIPLDSPMKDLGTRQIRLAIRAIGEISGRRRNTKSHEFVKTKGNRLSKQSSLDENGLTAAELMLNTGGSSTNIRSRNGSFANLKGKDKYQEWNVVELRGHSIRVDKIMGVSNSKIYIRNPSESKTSKHTEEKKISNLKRISPSGPKSFSMIFPDGYTLEVESEHSAEIISKLQILMVLAEVKHKKKSASE